MYSIQTPNTDATYETTDALTRRQISNLRRTTHVSHMEPQAHTTDVTYETSDAQHRRHI